jgi:hypothetical protein
MNQHCSSLLIAALPPPSTERLRLSGCGSLNSVEAVPRPRGVASLEELKLNRKGGAFPHWTAAKPQSSTNELR